MDPAIEERLKDNYLGTEYLVCEKANEQAQSLLMAPASEIASEIELTIKEAEKTDKRILEAINHDYYMIMAERLSQIPSNLYVLKELKPFFEQGDGSKAIEAVANIAVVRGICRTIVYTINNL